jgi:hypothetical protein
MCVMFLGVGEAQMRLTNRATVLAEQSGDLYHKFNLPLSYRQRLECSRDMAVADYMPASTDRTYDFVGVDRAVKDCLAVKNSVQVCCTQRIPKV